MGQPMFEFRPLIESGAVTVFSSNFALYGDMSRRVQQTLSRFAPAIEVYSIVYSIDESFIDLTGLSPDTDFDLWAKTVSRECRRCTGIPVSVGVSPTKTLAKIASKLCKQYPATRGGCWMHRQQDVEKVLKKFPIEDIWGIGRRYTKRFKGYFGMSTAWDFYSTPGTSHGSMRRWASEGSGHGRSSTAPPVSASRTPPKRRNRL